MYGNRSDWTLRYCSIDENWHLWTSESFRFVNKEPEQSTWIVGIALPVDNRIG